MVGVLLIGVMFFSGMAIGMSRGGWGNGWGMMGGSSMNDHMQRMMGTGTNSSNATPSVGSTAETVRISNFTFTPGNLQVPVGAKVTWTNEDSAPHTATAKDGSWDTGILNQGESKTLTFAKAGDYEYYCKVHPSMIARVTVK
jgi:plastocyanin